MCLRVTSLFSSKRRYRSDCSQHLRSPICRADHHFCMARRDFTDAGRHDDAFTNRFILRSCRSQLMKASPKVSRRHFLATTAVALAAPRVLTAQKSEKQLVIGAGEHRYEVLHDWPQLPDRYQWQTTHNVAIDREGLLYVIHEGRENSKDHPSIFVFDPKGKFGRARGKQCQGGGHGLEVRTEGKEQFLYVTGYQQLKNFAKLTLKGEPVWENHAPMDSGIYAAEEDTKPTKRWGR